MSLRAGAHIVRRNGLAERPLTMARLEISLRATGYDVTNVGNDPLAIVQDQTFSTHNHSLHVYRHSANAEPTPLAA